MLHALLEYAEQAGIDAEPGFAPKHVRWLLQFSPEGEYQGLTPASDDKKGREFAKVPHLKFSGDTPMRQFLVDTAQYVVLYGEDEPGEKLLRKHGFFLNLLREAGQAEPVLARIADALEDPDELAKMHKELDAATPKVKPSDNVTFVEMSADGARILVEQGTWHDWWRGYWPGLFKKKGRKGKVADEMRSLLTGELVEPATTHPKVKGLGDVGGNVETTLVGFNQDTFCSYGLEQSANAAVSADTAEAYAAALNQLIAGHSRRLAGAKVVYWYTHDVPPETDPVAKLLNGVDLGEAEVQEEAAAGKDTSTVAQANRRAGKLLEAVKSGKASDLHGLGECRYRALTLGGNAGRAVVRDWMEGSFEDLAANVTQWFEDFSIVNRHGDGLAPEPKFLAVLGAMVRDLKEVHPPLETALWKSAIAGLPIPYEAMARTLARVRMDVINGESPRHARLGLLKAYLIRKEITEMQPELNEHENCPAYVCGRIMAVLADIQRAALGDVGAGVVQRYYAAASATPALVLGKLVRGAQTAHLPKIDGGLKVWFDQQLADLWDRLDQAPPATMSLEDQTLFAMGYYQQKALRKKKTDLKEDSTDTE
ncbi:MAG: type I-C CRISPR-associated protein Cas8c/Csd1 [Phycisphaerae bacterium]